MNFSNQPGEIDDTGDQAALPTPEPGRSSAAPAEPAKPAFPIKTQLVQGAVASSPLWLGIVPFGLAYALAARTAGLNPFEIQGMSLIVYAGASQIIASGLFATATSGFSIILVTLIVNLRHVLFGTSLLSVLQHLKWWQKMLLAFGLTDEAYAVSVRKLLNREVGPPFLVGAMGALYLCWQLSTFAGLLLGGVIPDPTSLGLQLVFPLSFSVMLMPYLKISPGQVAALVAGVLAIFAKIILGGNWYILIGAVAGTLAGFLVGRGKSEDVT